MDAQARLAVEVAEARGLQLSEEEAAIAALVECCDFEARPFELFRQHEAGRLIGDLPTYLVPETWMFKLDHCALPSDAWRELFATVRYTKDRKVAPRPRRAQRLFRGATSENREGLSWTTMLDQAVYFARSRQAPDASGVVWTTTAPAERFLAYFGGSEHEIVTDVRGLLIEQIDPATYRPPWTARLPRKKLA